MSSPPSSQQPPPSTSFAEPAAHRRIKLTIKPFKLKSGAPSSSVDTPQNGAASSTPTSSHPKTSITIKPLKIKPPRSNTISEPPVSSTQDEEKKHLLKLIIKPPKPSPPPPPPDDDGDAMEVDVSSPEVVPPPQTPSPASEPVKEEPSVETLPPPLPPPSVRPSRPPPPPPKPKIPRPIKLKPLKEVLRRLITQIKRKDDYAFFLKPVDISQVPGYLDVIKNPMDLGTITDKIERGQYRSLEQFKDDFLLVMTNAKTFNPPPSLYHSEASKIEAWSLDQITRAAAHVIEYETDWNIDVVADEGPAPATSESILDQPAADAAVVSGDMPVKTRSPSVMSSAVGTPSLPTERSKRPFRGKKAPIVTESWEDNGHLPGFKDGIGAFPSCNDLAALMLELKLRGKRFTKKERLKREKEGPPYAPDGSLDYTEMENPFSVLQQLVPKSLNTPELVPLVPTRMAPSEAAVADQDASQPPDERRNAQVDGPVAFPPEKLRDILADPNRHTFANPPTSTSVVGKTKLRHWTITRNPPRATRARDEEEDGSLLGPQAKRRRVEHMDYGAFANLLGTIAAENGLKVDDFEEMFGSDERVLDQIRQSIEARELPTEATQHTKTEVEHRERLEDANEYIRNVVYGGVDGLAYFRSLAEFVGEYDGPLKRELDVPVTSGELGMPLAQWVATHIIDPLSLGNYSTLRATAEVLARANDQEKCETNAHASHAIARYLALANEDKHSIMEQIRELESLADPSAQIDIAPLLRKPEELFLAENEWAGREREQGQTGVTILDPIRAATISGAGAGAGAMLGLGLGLASSSTLPGQSRLVGAPTGDTSGAIEHALSVGAEALGNIARRILEGDEKLKVNDEDREESEDPLMRRTRLTLIALAKRAPIDRIARLPPELVPVHIRHIVPTLGS